MKDAKLTAAEKRRLKEAFENIPFAQLLGLKLGALARGSAELKLNIREELKRNRGLVHGGVTASLIDTAAAFAILTLLEPGQRTSTVDLTIHYLRPLLKGKTTAQARVVRAGRRLIVVSVDVFDESEVLVATALTSYLRVS
jgi:uncharacterized protein (TIGR00369 family)